MYCHQLEIKIVFLTLADHPQPIWRAHLISISRPFVTCLICMKVRRKDLLKRKFLQCNTLLFDSIGAAAACRSFWFRSIYCSQTFFLTVPSEDEALCSILLHSRDHELHCSLNEITPGTLRRKLKLVPAVVTLLWAFDVAMSLTHEQVTDGEI